MDKQTQSPMDRLKKVVAFLLGEDKLDGVSFGERAPGRPWFWWRIELRKAVKALESSAPQVAVPEPVGWVKWFDGEASFQPRDAILPEDAKQHGWQLVGLMRSLNAPTAPAGELRPDCSVCGAPSRQPVSDPDGLPGAKGYWLKDSGYGVDDHFDTLDEALSSASSLIEDYRTEAGADEWPSDADSITISAVTHVARFVHVRDNEYDLRMEAVAPAPDEREIAADAIETAIEVAVEAGRGKERATVSRLIGHMREYAKSLRAGKPEGGAS